MGTQSTVLRQLIAPVVCAMGYEFLGVEYQPTGRHSVLRIYIDNEAGVTLGDCERVSNQVSVVLDVEDLIHGPYTLEVSSPGLDRPLFTLEQFKRFIGRKVRLRLRHALGGRHNFAGEISGIAGCDVVLMEENVKYQLPIDNIDRARLVP